MCDPEKNVLQKNGGKSSGVPKLGSDNHDTSETKEKKKLWEIVVFNIGLQKWWDASRRPEKRALKCNEIAASLLGIVYEADNKDKRSSSQQWLTIAPGRSDAARFLFYSYYNFHLRIQQTILHEKFHVVPFGVMMNHHARPFPVLPGLWLGPLYLFWTGD